MEKQIKSKKRVADHGEVFTAERDVNAMLDLVKQETGKTAQEYIQLKMIAVAKERMLDPAGTIKQVAESLGFQHPQHFVRFFKRHEGCTPKEFRNRMAAS